MKNAQKFESQDKAVALHLISLLLKKAKHYEVTLYEDVSKCKRLTIFDWSLPEMKLEVTEEAAKQFSPSSLTVTDYQLMEDLLAFYRFFAEAACYGIHISAEIYTLWWSIVDKVFSLGGGICKVEWIRLVRNRVSSTFYRRKALEMIREEEETVLRLLGRKGSFSQVTKALASINKDEWNPYRLVNALNREMERKEAQFVSTQNRKREKRETQEIFSYIKNNVPLIWCQECRQNYRRPAEYCQDPTYPMFANCWEHKLTIEKKEIV